MSFSPGQGTWMCYCDEDGDSEIDPGESSDHTCWKRGYGSGASPAAGLNSSVPADGVSCGRSYQLLAHGLLQRRKHLSVRQERSIAIRVLPASGVVRMWQYRNAWEELK